MSSPRIDRPVTLVVDTREVRTKEFIARRQTSTQTYRCDECPEIIHDETDYVRVVYDPEYRGGDLYKPIRKQSGSVEMFHVRCWNDGVEQDAHRL